MTIVVSLLFVVLNFKLLHDRHFLMIKFCPLWKRFEHPCYIELYICVYMPFYSITYIITQVSAIKYTCFQRLHSYLCFLRRSFCLLKSLHIPTTPQRPVYRYTHTFRANPMWCKWMTSSCCSALLHSRGKQMSHSCSSISRLVGPTNKQTQWWQSLFITHASV